MNQIEEWLKTVTDNVMEVMLHLDLFKKLDGIIGKNKKLSKMDPTLLKWMRKSFIVDLVIGLGRICDKDSRTDSLVCFLHELKENKNYLTRERYVKLYNKLENSMLDIPNKSFDRLAGKGEQVFPLDKITADIKRLTVEEPYKKIIDFRNQYVAHSQKVKDASLPTYEELLESYKVIEEIVKKYNLLIRASNFIGLTPEIQGYWQEVLTTPWIDAVDN